MSVITSSAVSDAFTDAFATTPQSSQQSKHTTENTESTAKTSQVAKKALVVPTEDSNPYSPVGELDGTFSDASGSTTHSEGHNPEATATAQGSDVLSSVTTHGYDAPPPPPNSPAVKNTTETHTTIASEFETEGNTEVEIGSHEASKQQKTKTFQGAEDLLTPTL